jgi:Tfp pilus assembly protein PilF
VFDETLKLVLALHERRPAPNLPRRLNALFERLGQAADASEASQVEDAIWGVWMSHPDPVVEERLELATRAIGDGDHAGAGKLLDQLVEEHPGYAEAWNKRATLYFRMGRDFDSVRDIRRTLELEPRHFGAVCGFGQICLRHGERTAALFAFDAALRINPHLGAVRAASEELAAEARGTAH